MKNQNIKKRKRGEMPVRYDNQVGCYVFLNVYKERRYDEEESTMMAQLLLENNERAFYSTPYICSI